MTTKTQINLAIDIIEGMIIDGERLGNINKELRAIYGDFSPEPQRMTPLLESRVVKLLDDILSDGLASYFLYEGQTMKNGGKIIEKNGTEWPMQYTEQLRAYAYHLHSLEHEKCPIPG